MKKILFSVCLWFPIGLLAQPFGLTTNQGQLTYQPDEKGNIILDYSYCGYRLSESDIPFVSAKVFVKHESADAAPMIQSAIDYVSQLLPDPQGFRGAVLLDSGTFQLSRPIRITASGVVLRGNIHGRTVLLKTGNQRGAVIYIEGVDNRQIVHSENIHALYTPAGSMNLSLEGTNAFQTGDRLLITRTATKEWIARMQCDHFGGGITALGWKPGEMNLTWDRMVVASQHERITLNAPIPLALDTSEAVISVKSYLWPGRIRGSAVEFLTLQSDYDPSVRNDEDHAWTGISVENAEDCWIRKVNFVHFAGSAVVLQSTASRVTVQDCMAREPVSEIGGMRRIAFLNMGQLNLIQRVVADQAIHAFAVGMNAPGPNAFVQCYANNALGFSGAIDSWSPGILFDLVDIDGHKLRFANLGQYKNGAGWTTANSVFWQCTAAVIECYSPPSDQPNRAFGCWGQFQGNGLWRESNNHVQPRSLFYAQLQERLGKDVSHRARLQPVSTEATSSPTLDEAEQFTQKTKAPLLTLEQWMNQMTCEIVEETGGWKEAAKIRISAQSNRLPLNQIKINEGRLTDQHGLLSGKRMEVNWWSGKLRPAALARVRPHITRFVPGREGHGLTDRIDSVVQYLKTNQIVALDHTYGLWYDRRRDDHQRVKRHDGDVWAPFYEQPFARSGIGTAWDGLSKYDLTRPNKWYWSRLKEFASKAEKEGILLYHQHFFQHNILEAGAHWVDSPWRTENNINHTAFPEPVHFAGDKRIFMADLFYDVTHPDRKLLYENYIRHGLDQLSKYSNVIHFLSAEYTGPLHFMEFWLDVIADWEAENGVELLIALSATKDVQDAILNDPVRSKIVDIIDIRYWHYRNDGTVYAPEGGKHLAPRQHARLVRTGKSGFDEVFRAVNEYRVLFPEKPVLYHAQASEENAWAVFFAGGSCPAIPVADKNFLQAASKMSLWQHEPGKWIVLGNSDTGFIIYSYQKNTLPLPMKRGKYVVKQLLGNKMTSFGHPMQFSATKTHPFQLEKGIFWVEKR